MLPEAPMPWIGMYVAAASLVCILAMAADVFQGFRNRKLWFPCKFFTLNAAYLTLLGVAMKLPVDLTAQMPGVTDQVAKLTSITFLSTIIEARIRIFLSEHYSDPRSFILGSSYKWSTFVIHEMQTFGVVVGTIAPTFRCVTATRLRCSGKRVKSYKTEFKTENYWIKRLVGWKESSLALGFRSQICKKLVSSTKNLIVDLCIGVQIVIVLASKLIMLISFVFISPFLLFGDLYYKVISKHIFSSNHPRSELEPAESDLSRYVLYLEGEQELLLQIMKHNRNATDHFIQKGKNQQPKYLKKLLDKSKTFMGVARFDSDHVSSLHLEEPLNCWSLPVVTLTSIAIALPSIEKDNVKLLLRSVNEGLWYAKLIEKFLNAKTDMLNIRNAADSVWSGVYLFRKWLNADLQKIALNAKNFTETLVKLADIAKKGVIEFKKNMNGDPKENPLNWPIKVIAANSMYRISQTVLQDTEGSNETLFEELSIMIADILCACLTNLPRVIHMKFFEVIEKREDSVRHAAQLIGEMEEILKILQERKLPSLDPADKLAYIDEWRDYAKANTEAFTSLNNDGTSSSGSGEV
ncbi:uncharacterized protein LOC132304039 [Cornus florida]|uniref:uncharacterized protein LOC132304039 n=1 Tax=Cornus florida TaxID=4283 RepID=UPI00289B47B7|nr:uncharacterized protein LOC132304039 [Cornus florida]